MYRIGRTVAFWARLRKMAAFLSVCLLFAGCAAADVARRPQAAQGAASGAGEGEKLVRLPYVPSLDLGEYWFAFRVKVGGSVVSLPLNARLRDALGWDVGEAAAIVLDAGQTADIVCETPDGGVSVRLANTGGGPLTLEECPVVGVLCGTAARHIDARAAPVPKRAEVWLPGGIGLGVQGDAVSEAYGTPDAGSGGQMLAYSAGRGAQVLLQLSDGVVDGFTMLSLAPLPQPPKEDELPPEVNIYRAPAVLGGEIWSHNILYADSLYTLPAPAAAFLENGWVLCNEDDVAPGGFCMGVGLRRGNQILRTTLYNLSDTRQPLEGCFVVMAESSNSTRIPLAIPGGIDGNLTYGEAIALLGEADETERDMNSHTITYMGPGGKVVMRFVPDEEENAMRMFDFEVWYLGNIQ